MFQAPERLVIGSVDNMELEVRAQYNPKELELTKQIGWAEHDVLSERTPALRKRAAQTGRGGLHLEFTGRKGRSMTLELLFDGFEDGKSVEPSVTNLEMLSSPLDAQSLREELRRPHLCVVVWGDRAIPKFRCVIESLTVKYTMFSRSGAPLRAVCTVKLKEATHLSTSVSEKEQFTGLRRRPA